MKWAFKKHFTATFLHFLFLSIMLVKEDQQETATNPTFVHAVALRLIHCTKAAQWSLD